MNDLINGAFELLGGLLIGLSIRRLLRDRVVKGISWVPVAFFTAWGFWNLHYYPSLDQWWSFAGGIVVVTANALWLLFLLYFSLRRPVAPDHGI